jgi:hypothetical protein
MNPNKCAECGARNGVRIHRLSSDLSQWIKASDTTTIPAGYMDAVRVVVDDGLCRRCRVKAGKVTA